MLGWFRVASSLASRVRQSFDRDVAVETCVASPIHLAHAAGADQADDLIGTEARARSKTHCCEWLELYAPDARAKAGSIAIFAEKGDRRSELPGSSGDDSKCLDGAEEIRRAAGDDHRARGRSTRAKRTKACSTSRSLALRFSFNPRFHSTFEHGKGQSS